MLWSIKCSPEGKDKLWLFQLGKFARWSFSTSVKVLMCPSLTTKGNIWACRIRNWLSLALWVKTLNSVNFLYFWFQLQGKIMLVNEGVDDVLLSPFESKGSTENHVMCGYLTNTQPASCQFRIIKWTSSLLGPVHLHFSASFQKKVC